MAGSFVLSLQEHWNVGSVTLAAVIPRASHATIGNQTEQHNQLIVNKEREREIVSEQEFLAGMREKGTNCNG
jgi:hypothetical protein